MTVYLLHLDKPLSRGTSPGGKALLAGHYLGWTDDLIGRMFEHVDGKGSRFTQVCVLRGVDFLLARVWEGDDADRTFERRLKNWKNAPLLCPICNPTDAMKYGQLNLHPSGSTRGMRMD